MKLHSFNITNFRVDGGAMFGVVPKLLWSKWIPADADNLIPLALRSLLVEVDDRVFLIDNGIGNKQSKKFYKYLYLFNELGVEAGLAQGGYNSDQITDVILTHLHFDHCGGSLYRNDHGEILPSFPNAKYWVSQAQWDNAMHPNPREADAFLDENLLPIQEYGLLHLVSEEAFLHPQVELRFAHGHTPGQIIPIIHHPKGKVVFGGDLFPTKAHVPIKYNMAYDLDVTTTIAEKQRFLEDFNDGSSIILFEHDTVHECGKLSNGPKGIQVGQTFTLQEWLTSVQS